MSVEIKNKGQARIFHNPFLESLTKTRPWVIYAMYIPLVGYLLYYCYSSFGFSVLFIVGLFAAGMISWTLFEYLAHRYLFHFETGSRIGQRMVYIFHGNHHEYPRDRMRLFMPPLPSIIFSVVLFGIIWLLFFLITGSGAYAFGFFPGFLIGYLLYVSMHYAIHAFAPPRFMKSLWRSHHLHHYKYPEKGFGVSSPFWDIVFGTVPEQDLKKNMDSAPAVHPKVNDVSWRNLTQPQQTRKEDGA